MHTMKYLTAITLLATVCTAQADPPWPPEVDFQYPHMPYIQWEPGPDYADSERMFQGIPSIARAPGGRLWATWYGGGTGEAQDNYVLLATSSDDGRTWSAPKLIIDPPFRASEPAVWVDPNGTLWFIFNLYPIRSSVEDRNDFADRFEDIASYNAFIGQYNFVGTQMWAMTTENPDAENPEWDPPRLLAMESHNMNKPTVLHDGTWLWPASPVTSARGLMPRPLYSDDDGRTFYFRGEVPVPEEEANAHEYQVVERNDGSLWLLNRVRSGIGESFSHDGGATWTEMQPAAIAHTVSRFFITRLDSGNLLLVKHGAIDADVGRQDLMAFLSEDDGATWSGGLMIDERRGVSYPDGEQGDDGLIRIIYDYNRHHDKEILMAVFTEVDVAAGEVVSEEAAFRLVVNKATSHNPVHQGDLPHDNADGALLRTTPTGAWAKENAEVLPFTSGSLLFTDREYKLIETPAEVERRSADALLQEADTKALALEGAVFLQLPIEGEQTLRCTREGMLYMLTPRPERNADSQEAVLEAQGFERVALPEFPLFGPSSNNFVSLYQRHCAEGDEITIGKGRTPVLSVSGIATGVLLTKFGVQF